MEAIRAVEVVPILDPNRIGTAACRLIMPLAAIVTKMPVTADDDCKITVITIPTRIPMKGCFSPVVMRLRKGG